MRFPPYTERDNTARGTTVQPYLEAFYHYDSGPADEQPLTQLSLVASATTWGADMGIPTDTLGIPTDTLQVLTPPPPRPLGQQGSWVSEDPCFLLERDMHSRVSNNSSDKTDHSTENISMRKSRVSSRENGEIYMYMYNVHVANHKL